MTKEEIERAHETATKEWARSEMNQRAQGLLDHLEARIQRRVAQELATRAVLVGERTVTKFGVLNAAAWFVMGAAVTYWILRSIEAAE